MTILNSAVFCSDAAEKATHNLSLTIMASSVRDTCIKELINYSKMVFQLDLEENALLFEGALSESEQRRGFC